MTSFLAVIAGAVVAGLTHALIGEHVSFMTDFVIGALLGGAAYVASFYWLKKLKRGS